MDERAPDGDPAEGLEAVTLASSATASSPGPDEIGLARLGVWTRTIKMVGPADWLEEARMESLADGIHMLGTRAGYPCTIEVDTTEASATRGMIGKPTNGMTVQMRSEYPEAWEAVHGIGSAHDDKRLTTPPVTPNRDDPSPYL